MIVSALRQTIAMIGFVATLAVGFALTLGWGKWNNDVELFTIVYMMYAGPLAVAVLALDYAFLRSDVGFAVLGLNYSLSRFDVLALPFLAIMAVAPFVAYRLGLIQPSNGWIVFSPIWAAVFVHRVIIRGLTKIF